MPEILFWSSLSIVAYVYFGFPALVAVLGKVLNRQVFKAEIRPDVSIIIAAYNEGQQIAERIENLLELDYPPQSLEIIVASDGSTDATESIVARYSPRVRLLGLPRQGKAAALNAAAAVASGEIFVFSDANTMFDKAALRKLVSNFADRAVGAVAGHKVYTLSERDDSGSRGEKLYWSYDSWLKKMETATGSAISADGAIYAIRHRLYQPVEDPAVTDDFAISTVAVQKGYRLVFEPEAVACERAIPDSHQEFRRKVRIMTRGLRAVFLRRRLLNPFRYGFYAVEFFSHKLLRRLVPLFLLVLLVSSLIAAIGSGFYSAALGLQVAFYAAALLGSLLRRQAMGRSRLLLIPFFFCLANLSSLVALFHVISGRRIEQWLPQRHLAIH